MARYPDSVHVEALEYWKSWTSRLYHTHPMQDATSRMGGLHLLCDCVLWRTCCPSREHARVRNVHLWKLMTDGSTSSTAGRVRSINHCMQATSIRATIGRAYLGGTTPVSAFRHEISLKSAY